MAELLRLLKLRRVITDYAQAALLLHSVKERACGHYLSAFADADVPYHHAPAASRRLQPEFPKGRVCVTTIHQAKGLEWPVVAVGSLDGFGGDDEVGWDLEPLLSPSRLSSRRSASPTSTGCASTTWLSPGLGTCWFSPPPRRRRIISPPSGMDYPAGPAWTPPRGTNCSASVLPPRRLAACRRQPPTRSFPTSSG